MNITATDTQFPSSEPSDTVEVTASAENTAPVESITPVENTVPVENTSDPNTDQMSSINFTLPGITTVPPTNPPVQDDGNTLSLWLILALAAAAVLTLALVFILKKRSSSDGQANAYSFATESVDGDAAVSASRYVAGVAQILGSRANQEDSFCISNWHDAAAVAKRGILAAVADGVGGMSNGQVASSTAVRAMLSRFELQEPSLPMETRLLDLAACAQREVLRAAQQAGRCGTTLVSVLIQNDHMVLLSIGDSRIALYRSGILLPLNREHVLGKENDEAAALGLPFNGSQKRQAITAYLGKENLRLIDRTITPMQLIAGDRILLMSDGVFNILNADEIISTLKLAPQQAAQAIVEAVAAKKHPHQDNATVAVIAIN